MKSFKRFMLEAKEKVIGKKTPDAHYVHKNYEHQVFDNDALNKAKSHLPKDYDYQITKRDHKTGEFSFIQSPDWDSSPEPLVGHSIKVKNSGELVHTKMKNDPQIYHHKHEFVGGDYKGFDIEKSKLRSKEWKSITDEIKNSYDPSVMRKIGTLSYWKNHILSKLNDSGNK